MKTINEQFEQFNEVQKKNLEPLLAMNAKATDNFERLARQNQAVADDWMDYVIALTRVPTTEKNPTENAESYLAETRSYAEKMMKRSAEYSELAQEMTNQLAKAQADK